MKENDCMQCGACQDTCLFLQKYQLTLADRKRIHDLAYHCFLCGACSQVCPQGLDGKQAILDMRRKQVRAGGGKLGEKGYGLMLLEKKHDLFANYKGIAGKSVLFPGCNFPSFYAKTYAYLEEILKPFGIGRAYGCCGKPLSELGLEEESQKLVGKLEAALVQKGVEEVILLCPNCYDYLKGKLSVKVTSIYEKLMELGILKKTSEKEALKMVFLPCPDRYKREWFDQIQACTRQGLVPLEGVQCCGLGGCAGSKEADLVQKLGDRISTIMKGQKVYVYCASCASSFARQGIACQHMLCHLLQVEESPDVKGSLVNRARLSLRGIV